MQVPSIQDVSALSAGSFHSLALRQDGRLLAFGNNDFGQLGDATFARQQDAVLAVNSNASGFFNATEDARTKVPAALDIAFFVVAEGTVSGTSASVKATTRFTPVDQGKSGKVFITATVPSTALNTMQLNQTPVASHSAPSNRLGSDPANPAFTLIQLTPSGWQTVVDGQLISYASGVLDDQLAAQTILDNTDTTNLKGAEFCVGYGASAQDMVSNGNIRAVASIPGASTTSSCVVGGTLSVGLSVAPGWNLLANPVNQILSMADRFDNVGTITSVWKWDGAAAQWQFYSPAMTASELQSYCASQGYAVLTAISPGDGFWINAKVAADLGSVSGAGIYLRQSSLASGWNLVSTASPITARDFNLSLSTTPPTAAQAPINLTSLWAWDNTQANWYFYAPSLDGQGGSTLNDYLSSQGYRDFVTSGKTLGHGAGFWVKRP